MWDAQQGELRLRFTNTSGQPVVAGVAYEARVGGWFRNRSLGTGDAHVIRLRPGSTEELTMPVYVAGYSPDSFLRLRFGPAEPAPGAPGRGRLRSVEAEHAYDLSRSPWARDDMERFSVSRTTHLEVFARRGADLIEELPRIAREREDALRAIVQLLDVEPPDRIRLVLYPDPFLKWIDTGEWGTGWAFESTLVEVVGGSQAMDRFHELVHVVAGRVGDPPALLDEGLAVFVAERLGGDALRFLGREETIGEAVCADFEAGDLFSLEHLVAFDAIGGDGTRPVVSYPQSAAFVGFLVDRHGMEGFLDGYARMGDAGGGDPLADFEAAFGSSLGDVERAWREALTVRCGRGA